MRKVLGVLTLFLFSFLLISCDKKEVKHIVTFNSVGGSNIEVREVIKGELVPAPTNPTKDGFTFEGWYKEDTYQTEWKFTTDKVEEDIVLYAKWKENDPGPVVPDKVKVIFNLNYTGAARPTEVEIDKGTKVPTASVPTIPERENFEFLGWSTKADELVKFELDGVVNANITVYAIWETTLEVHTVTIDLNDDSEPTTIEIVSGMFFEEDNPTRDGYVFLHWLVDGQIFDLLTPITEDITLVANWVESGDNEGVAITNPQELIELFETGGDGTYYLATDLDMSKVEFEGSKAEFTGVLDGNGKTIKNFNVVATEGKVGAMFGKLTGATIENLVIMRSSLHAVGDGAGFISSYGYGGTKLNNITFVNVTIEQTTGSYAGLLFADSDAAGTEPIEISNIIVLNNDDNPLMPNAFGAVLVGYLRQALTIKFENIYIESNITTKAANAAAIIARIGSDDLVIEVKDVVYKGNITATKEVAVVIGKADKKAKLTVENLFIEDTTISMSQSNVPESGLVVAKDSLSEKNFSKIYHTANVKVIVQGNEQELSHSELVSATLEWFTASSFNKDFFLFKDGKITHNHDFGEVVAETLTIGRDSYNKLFIKDVDTELNLQDLVVSVSYSDGSSVLVPFDDLEINSSSFNKDEIGTYYIIIAAEGLETEIAVTVVEIAELVAVTLDMDLLFIGDTFNTDGLVVHAILEDESIIILKNDELVITLAEGTFGERKVTVSFKDSFTTDFNVTILEEAIKVVNNEVKIVVDQNAALSGVVVDNVITVKTVKEAINIIDKSNLASTVNKIVNIKNGTYYEKLRVTKENVIFIGESRKETIIDFDAASGTKTPLGGEWGTQGSATFTVATSAKGFMATNLTFSNSFDYNANEGIIGNRQAVALVTEADQVIFYQVDFKGHQDTLYAKNGRQWYLDVYVEGNVDYIFGNGGPAFFEESEIRSLNKETGYITANKGVGANGTSKIEYGYVFYNNKFTFEEGTPVNSVDLGRPWEQNAAVAYINNKFGAHITERGWTDWNASITAANANFYEFGNKQGDLAYTSTAGKQLEANNADLYINKDIVFARLNGQLDFVTEWDYLGQLRKIAPNHYDEGLATVTFMNGDDIYKVKTVVIGTTVTEFDEPINGALEFLDWITNEGTYSFNDIITGDLVVYAKWSEEEQEPEEGLKYELYNDVNTDGFFNSSTEYNKNVPDYPLTDNILITQPLKLNSGGFVKFTTVYPNLKLQLVTATAKGEVGGRIKVNNVVQHILAEGFTVLDFDLDDAGEYTIARDNKELVLYYVAVYSGSLDIGEPGDGNEDYEPEGTPITNADELYEAISNENKGEKFYLVNDIDLDGVTWLPKVTFQGQLDGNFKVISNLTQNSLADYGGFIYRISGATIKNLTINNFNIIYGKERGGLLVGDTNGKGNIIDNIKVIGGSISGSDNAAALVGRVRHDTTITNISIVDTDVGGKYSGMVTAYIEGGTVIITDIYVDAINSGTERVGGIVGRIKSDVSLLNILIERVVLKVDVTTDKDYGGIVGDWTAEAKQLQNLVIEDVIISGDITTNGNRVGSIAGGQRNHFEDELSFIMENTYEYNFTTNREGGVFAETKVMELSKTWWSENLNSIVSSPLWIFDETLNVYKLK